MNQYYSNCSIVFNPITKELFLLEEFIYNVYFKNTINISKILIEAVDTDYLYSNENSDENKIKNNQEKVCIIDQQDSITKDNINDQQQNDDNNQYKILNEDKTQENVDSILQISKKEEQLKNKENKEYDKEEFDLKSRHFVNEFFKYEDLKKYSLIQNVEQFVINLFHKNKLSLDKLIVYIKLREMNKFTIEDAQNFGVDYTLYNLTTEDQNDGQKSENEKKSHIHSTYLLKIDPEFDKWLGYARIAHNVHKKIIIAELECTSNSFENQQFNEFIQIWMSKKLQLTIQNIPNQQELKKENTILFLDIQQQLIQIEQQFKLHLICFGLSREN